MFVKTGFGYYVNHQGKKLHKYELPKGEHPDPVGYTVVEVANQAELDAITLDKSDEHIAREQQNVIKQQNRKTAMLKLKGLGLNDDEIASIVG